MKKLFSLLIIFTLIAGAAFGQTVYETAIKELDAQDKFLDKDYTCTLTMVSEKPGEDKSVTQLKLFRRDEDDKFLMLILKPTAYKGQGYLQVGENTWSYDPESREFSHFSMNDNVKDSETKNSDFKEVELLGDYEIKDGEEGTLGKYEVYIITLEAKTDEVAYPTMKYWITKNNNLLLKVESYSLNGRLMRTQYNTSYTKIGDHYVPDKMLFTDNLNEGEKTQVTVKDISLNRVPDTVFTKSYLERVNR